MTADPDDALPFHRIGPDRPVSPVVLSVPHAGRNYSEALLASARVPLATLAALEDPLVDRLAWRAQADGAVAIVARAPRAEIDLNRDEREVDPAMIVPPPPGHTLLASARIRGGLGLVPARLGGATLWNARLSASELVRRIETIHRPYHAAIAGALEAARRRFGVAVLIDCHSMPPRRRDDPDRADIVLGDRHGTSSGPAYVAAASAQVRRAGYSVSRNAPYAGGHITGRHGRPSADIHAFQVEIDRSLYLDAASREPGPGFDRIAQLLGDIAAAVVAQAIADGALPEAAE
ncbi:N-formylglutamate amidohydrolase [Allosphingosinicella indica]|uniref:N-formylglutamate amidohydrolase n=1 Tax=Allosphingosinicella indica TaxID=941907 RepID=A0A1X7FZG7_9SPHN|nr:N-formylglutamate amidohydrolase [Allosphingosinicella indica]SMF61469.1 N-formylglutamate amidohydrolase [Allosphingosinicella indica]